MTREMTGSHEDVDAAAGRSGVRDLTRHEAKAIDTDDLRRLCGDNIEPINKAA